MELDYLIRLLLLRVSCLQSNHQATAKINSYMERYRELRTMLTKIVRQFRKSPDIKLGRFSIEIFLRVDSLIPVRFYCSD